MHAHGQYSRMYVRRVLELVASEILLWAVKELFILARFGIAYEYVEPGEVSYVKGKN
jgi:uncharacterized cupin superfamily protein